MRLLIIEDSLRLRETLTRALTRLGHAVDAAPTAEEGEHFAQSNTYEVIVLDLMLPGMDGLTLLRRWRERGLETPILLLTALHGVEDRVRGLAAGADDYLVKPFALAELAARLEALARRRHGYATAKLHYGTLEIDLTARTLHATGKQIMLTAREYALLECLARRPGQVLSREQIEAHLYNEDASPVSNAVDAAIYSLRRKLTAVGEQDRIQTRRGLGYVLEP